MSTDMPNSESDEGMNTCDNVMPHIKTAQTRTLLRRFLCVCTATKIMNIGSHWEVLGKFRMGVGSAMQNQMSTWYPKHYIPIFIIGMENEGVAFYVHSINEMFSVSQAMEAPRLPEGVVLCAHYTEDKSSDNEPTIYTPRILIYDIAMLHGKRVHEPAESRYGKLRDLYTEYFTKLDNGEKKPISPIFTLQWVGYYSYALAFVEGKVDVKHKVGGIIALSDNAINPTRTLRVKLPFYVQQQHANVEPMNKPVPLLNNKFCVTSQAPKPPKPPKVSTCTRTSSPKKLCITNHGKRLTSATDPIVVEADAKRPALVQTKLFFRSNQ